MFIREGRIEIVFRRDEGCGQHLTCVTLVFTTWACRLLRRDQAAVIQVERQVFSQRSEWDREELGSKLKDRRPQALAREERQRFCTEELVMFDVAMESHR